MISIVDFLSSLRFLPSLKSVIPVGVCMGFPVPLNGNILYIPFFTVSSEEGENLTCEIHSEIKVSFPDGHLFFYRLCTEKIAITVNKASLQQETQSFYNEYLPLLNNYLTQHIISPEVVFRAKSEFFRYLPGGFLDFYRHCEEQQYDKR